MNTDKKSMITMKDNILDGEINGYKISGIIYNDSQMIVSIPVTTEVSEHIIDSFKHPDYIKDVRYFNGKVDFLTDVILFDVFNGQKIIEEMTHILEEEHIQSDFEYVEERIEESKSFEIKALVIFVINLIIGSIVSIVVFEMELGQSLGSIDGSFYMSYYAPVIFLAYPVLLFFLNERLFTKMKMFNRYNNKSAKKYEWTSIGIIIISAVLSHIFFIVYHGVKLFDLSSLQSIKNFSLLVNLLYIEDAPIGVFYFANTICLILGIGILISKLTQSMKRMNK